MSNKYVHFFVAVLVSFVLIACEAKEMSETSQNSEQEQSENINNAEAKKEIAENIKANKKITDSYGREVLIPSDIKRVVCVGTGSLRLLSYLQKTDCMVGVETSDTKYAQDPKRDYAFVLHEKIKGFPQVGKGGGAAYTAYPEALLQVQPDIIFCSYSKEGTEQLARETGIPVVGVRYQSINFVDQSFYKSLRLMASVLGAEVRAEELITAIDGYKADLQKRTQNVQSDKTVYVGAVSFNGSHGFSGTYSQFGPFSAVNAKNVADDESREGYYEADLEQVLVWNPDIIFIDPSNMNIVSKEYSVRSDYFKKLNAVNAGQVYTMPSFNNYSTNITYCLINGYWAGKILYPEQFADVELKEKANEILSLFLGKAYFEEMEQLGLYYGVIDLSS